MLFFRNFFTILLITLFSFNVFSQNFEWLRVSSGYTDNLWNGTLCADNNGGCTQSVFRDSSFNYSQDTLYFGTFRFIKPMGPGKASTYLVKYDSSGKVLKAMDAGNYGGFGFITDSSGNYYCGGRLTFNNKVGGKSYNWLNGRCIIAKYDNDLNIKWAIQTATNGQEVLLFNSENHLYFIIYVNDSTNIGGKRYLLKDGRTAVIGEFSAKDGSILWSKVVYDTPRNTRFNIYSLIKINNNIYLGGDIYGQAVIGKDTFNSNSAFILKMDTLGNYQSSFILKTTGNIISGRKLISNGKMLFLGGTYIGSIQKDSFSFISQGTGKQLYIACVSQDFTLKWFYTPEVPKDSGSTSDLKSLGLSNNFIYGGAQMSGIVNLDGSIVKTSKRQDVLIFKIDLLGNILWGALGGTDGYVWDVSAISRKSVFAGGVFVGKYILIGNTKDSSVNPNNSSTWITKISDYDITRGVVNFGPYCAGDSIEVPYTILGKFDTINYFIAELSDQNGNFNANFHELGRIKSNKEGKVIGVIPSLKVFSSGNYRIRIRSTKPAIQSYYVADSLRLLIYSNDKADPGPPETICFGDSIRLNTYGGTKWFWGPNYNINNVNLRQPIVWPLKDTIYTIIISDSSGCGRPDTSSKKIIVRKLPIITLKFTDTLICDNLVLRIPVRLSGGDSAYQWQMYYVTPTQWFPFKSGFAKTIDTLSYLTGADLSTKDLIALVIKDGCTKKQDTAYLTVGISLPVTFEKKFKDTILCNGNRLKLFAKVKPGSAQTYIYQWKDLNSQIVLSNSDSFVHIAKTTTKIQLLIFNGCNSDTNVFKILVKPPLKADILTENGAQLDTTICYGEGIKLFSRGMGGITSDFRFDWYLDDMKLSTEDSFFLDTKKYFSNISESKILKLILNDNCTLNPDTLNKIIVLNPSPNAQFITKNTCNLNPIEFVFTGSKAPLPLTNNFQWDFDGEGTSALENPTQKLTAGIRPINLKVIASNGCSDELIQTIEIKSQAKPDFFAEDLCEDSMAKFNNKTILSTGNVNYFWYFGDGNTSMMENPIHRYDVYGVTKTFNVMLVAKVPNGCSDSITKAITINSKPLKGFTYTVNFQTVNFSAKETSANQYLWLFGDGDSAKTSTKNHSYTYSKLTSGKYTPCLRVTNLAGCKSDTCLDIQILGSITTIEPYQFRIYPNPNIGIFTLESTYPKSTMEIFNSVGQKIYQFRINKTKMEFNLDLEDGIYFIFITDNNVLLKQKFVVQR